MIDELEALVGHVFVVGGRAVGATPPGALVELPPKKPQRGREQDTFFTLVTPSGANQGQAAFYEQLAKLAAHLYFHSGGGVTSGLREAISAVNSNLIEHNMMAGLRYEANMICMVLRGHETYVARTGSCLCLLRQNDTLISLPEDLRDEYALNGLPLGYSPAPDIKLSHYDVAPSHVMVMGDAGFAQVDRSKLSDALGAGNIQSIIEGLKPLGAAKTQAIVVEFVSVDTPDPTILTPQPGANKITRSSSAPAAVATAALSPMPAKTSTATTSTAPATSASTPIAPAQKTKSQSMPSIRQTGSTPVTPSTPISQSTPVGSTPLRRSTPAAATAMPQPAPVGEIVAETANTANRAGRKAAGGAASFLGMFTRALSRMLDQLLPEPAEEDGPNVPTMLAAALAILVPIVVVFIVVALRLSQVDLTAFEQTVQEMQKLAAEAQAIPKSNVEAAKTAWLAVLQRIEDVENSTGHRGDPDLEDIKLQAQKVLDEFGNVTRQSATPLRSFTDSAQLVGPIIQGTTSMYTLDANLSAIYRDTLNQDSTAVLTRGINPVVQKGQDVRTRTVRQLVDILWMPQGGIERNNMLAALDTQGILITYSPTFPPAESQALPGSDLWVKPVALARWHDNLYVLDPGANQIWRYKAVGTSYPNAPEEYFDSEPLPDLKEAVDFGIDTTGNVYVLFSTGSLKKYNGGTEQHFDFNGLPEEASTLKSGSAMYLDNDSTLTAIYIADPLDQSIYQVTLAGKFLYRYRATDNNAFRHLTGVYADAGKIYVASGPVIYYFAQTDSLNTTTPVP
jgi:hypothetical protein